MASFVTLPTVEHGDARAIQQIITTHLKATGTYGVLPTPLYNVMDELSIKRDEDFREFADRFIPSLPINGAAAARRALSKTRGMADLDRRALYLPPLKTVGQNTWRDGHELTHVILRWHQIMPGKIYRDDNSSLCQSARDRFESEANYGAKNFIFQPGIFDVEVNDSPLDFARIVKMSERYAASIKATFFAAVSASVHPYVGLTYLKSDRVCGVDGLPKLHKPMMVVSPTFGSQDYDWLPPAEARTDWAQARVHDCLQSGEARITTGTQSFRFVWHSFWNQYELMVLLQLIETPIQFMIPPVAVKPVIKKVQMASIVTSSQ